MSMFPELCQVLHPAAESININGQIWDMYFKNLLPRLVKAGHDGNCGSAANCDTICLQVCVMTFDQLFYLKDSNDTSLLVYLSEIVC